MMMSKIKYLLAAYLVSTGLILAPKTVVSAQNYTDFSIAGEFFRTSQFHWSNDSRQLVFFNANLGGTSFPIKPYIDTPSWQAVDIVMETLSTGSAVWPLHPTLTEAELDLLLPTSFIYQSANGNLLIFAQESTSVPNYRNVVIANRTTQQVIPLGFLVGGASHPPDNFVVEWSLDSHAAVVAHYVNDTSRRVFHIEIPSFDDLQEIVVREFDVLIDGLPYRTTPAQGDDFLDLSDDGQSVLLIARDSRVDATENFFDRSPEVVIWRPLVNEAITVPVDFTPDEYTVGSFASDSSDILLFANLEGLYVHDVDSNTTETLLPGSVTEGPVRTFSPNGEWLTVVRFESLDFFYLGDLADQTE